MRVLLDEHLPHRLRQLFAISIEVVTVGYQGWKDLKNGDPCEKLRLPMHQNKWKIRIMKIYKLPAPYQVLDNHCL